MDVGCESMTPFLYIIFVTLNADSSVATYNTQYFRNIHTTGNT